MKPRVRLAGGKKHFPSKKKKQLTPVIDIESRMTDLAFGEALSTYNEARLNGR